ncbi:hypothetical protein FHR81_003454 [Actinoalloteichus hoggarensis]|uniref:Cas3 C-terminal domain-containing protein n=1 Tax=Actinoalloteichus hoggarensis TaxID=1470176 RepID=A0A221W7F4_9PSEU|nr:hypothetical protein [Actinoalloteichus hoggarensis]ASO21805.1 hypothetical protein AHOG_20940 [Actinoalloteichus hoggarensis]MBB5922402.1 hypothetical protein [Actinoalloteichus hoggarensis]
MTQDDRGRAADRVEPAELRLVILLADDVTEPATRIGEQSATPLAGDTPLVLHRFGELTEEMETALWNSSLRLTPPYEFSAAVVDALAELPTPAAFVDSGWLGGYRALVLPPDGVAIGGARVRYEKGLGLLVREY